MKFLNKIVSFKKWKNNYFTKDTFKKSNKLIHFLGGLITLILGLIAFYNIIAEPENTNSSDNTKNSSNITQNLSSIFSQKNIGNFNILIIRFEDYTNEQSTNCIGRSIQDNISIIAANEKTSLTLKAVYADSIPPPKNLKEAQAIQQKHNADLIIYGLAKNVLENCNGADVCIRYNIDEKLISTVLPAINPKTSKHDAEYVTTSPIKIEKGQLQIDALSFNHWIKTLVEIKANNPKKAFLELAAILRDSTNLDSISLSKKYLAIGNTYYSLRQDERALITYSKAISLNSLDKITHNKRGITNKKLKKYNEAIFDYNNAILLDSCYDHAYYNRGVANQRQANFNLAIKDLNKAIEINPEDEDYHIYLAYTYSKLGDYNTAMLYHNTAISLNPEEEEAYFYRGTTYKDSGEYDMALNDFSKALLLDSTYSAVYNSRGNIYKKLKKYDLALKDYNTSIKFANNTHTYAYYSRGVLFNLLKKYDLAISDLNQALKLNDSTFRNFYYRGLCHYEQKKYGKAIEDFNIAKSLDSLNPFPLIRKAHAYSKTKKFKLAIVEFTKAIKLNPELANSYNGRGVAFLKIEMYNQAISDFKNAVAKGKYPYYAYINLTYTYVIKNIWLFSIIALVIICIILRKKLKSLGIVIRKILNG